MRYAVMQSQLEAPDVERLKAAFRNLRFLTDMDAHILGNDAYGILLKNQPRDRALACRNALAEQGVGTEVVAHADLPPMPELRSVKRIECREESLMIQDSLGRSFPVEWRHLMMIAAGTIKLTEFVRKTKTRTVYHYRPDGSPRPVEEVDHTTKEERHHRLVLELIMERAVLRYSMRANPLLFEYLGDRRVRDEVENFRRVVQDLCGWAPHAAVNRGAFLLRENDPARFVYPSRNAFDEGVIWLLWRMRQAGKY